MKNTQKAKKCCKKGCPNKPAQGRKTCGQHGKTPRTIKTKPIHLDRVLRPFDARDFHADAPITPIEIVPFPTERPYIADVAVRSNGALLGLPTNLSGLKTLLADWLLRPGRSLYEIDALTPAHLPARDRERVIVDIAARLVRYDLGLGVLA